MENSIANNVNNSSKEELENNLGKVFFNYQHCSEETFAKEVNFKTEDFSKILVECFEIFPEIPKIDVFFELRSAQDTKKFSCAIHVVGKHEDYIQEEGDENFAHIVTSACHKTVNKIKKVKDKLKSHR